jgi:tRNA 2-thiouridine synthesizing protein E
VKKILAFILMGNIESYPDKNPVRRKCMSEKYIEFKNKKIPVDSDGYLINPADWSKDLADHIAASAGIKLTADHWWVINFTQNYLKENEFLPVIRVVVNSLRRAGLKDKANDAHLFKLFAPTPIRLACKIAGLHRPPPGFTCL